MSRIFRILENLLIDIIRQDIRLYRAGAGAPKPPLCKGRCQKSLIFDGGIVQEQLSEFASDSGEFAEAYRINPSVTPLACQLPLHKGAFRCFSPIALSKLKNKFCQNRVFWRFGEVTNMKLQFVEAGEIVTTHGVRGEVKVLCWLDDPEMLTEFDRCRIEGKDYEMESVRVQKTCNLVKLSGIDTMEDAQKLRGKVLELYREDIDDEVIFAAELIGVKVFADGACIGSIREVLDYPGNSVYVVRGEHEYMIPAVNQFILSTDMENNTMQVRLIEGMRSDEN